MNTEEIKAITIKELYEYYNNKIEEYENFVVVDNIEILYKYYETLNGDYKDEPLDKAEILLRDVGQLKLDVNIMSSGFYEAKYSSRKDLANDDQKSNIACIECFGCTECENCTKCNNCIKCKECKECNNCEKCISCTDCNSCEKCKTLNICNNCYLCISCTKCNNCKKCISCKDCKQCMKIKSGKDLKNVTSLGFDTEEREKIKNLEEK